MKLATSAVLLAIAGTCWAQVMPTGSGRALDANNLLGGGGWNSVRLSEPLFDGNNIVTGQVSGGRQFRGNIGYYASNQLHLDLPSSQIDNFVRDSAGLSKVMAGQSYTSTPYLNPSSTVLSSAAIAQGMNMPGTSMPPITYTPASAVQQLYDSTLKSYQQGQTTMVPPVPGLQQVAVDYSRLPGPTANETYLRPSVSTLFGVMPKQEQQKLSQELADITDLSKTTRMDSQWDTNQPEPSGNADRSAADVAKAAERYGRTKQPAAAATDKNRLPSPGQDIFVDIMLLMQKNAANLQSGLPSPQQLAGVPGAGPEQPPQAEPEKPKLRKTEEEEMPRPQELRRAALAAAEAEKKKFAAATEAIDGQVIVHRLAGSGRDPYNIQLLQGQISLKQGEYYRAGSYFDNAVSVNGGNPLGYLGGAVALFAAQEPMSSAIRLRAAMMVFPPLMQTAVDVNGLLGMHVVEVRIQQLEAQMEKMAKPEPSLLFLAAFIKANSGEMLSAADVAAKLLEVSKDSVHQAYAHSLLRRVGREASSQPSVTPAEGVLLPSMAPTTEP